MVTLLCVLLAFIRIINGSPLQWCFVTANDVTSTNQLGVDIQLSEGKLSIDATITNYGCGGMESHIFAFINDTIDGNMSINSWLKIRYTMEFWGSSSCWSILGNTHYGNFENNFNSGLHPFDTTNGDSIMSNNLLYGSWNGTNVTCNNEISNFWHALNGREGYKGSITVEQRRNINIAKAGIGSGHSCTNTGISKVRFSDIQIAYQTDNKIDCLIQTDTVSDDNAVVWAIIVGVLVFCVLVICAFIRRQQQRIQQTIRRDRTEVICTAEGVTGKIVGDETKELKEIKETPSAPLALIEDVNDVSKHGDNICIFCCSKEANMCSNPCGHTFVCNRCYDGRRKELKQCPQCRQEIVNCIRIFKAGFQS